MTRPPSLCPFLRITRHRTGRSATHRRYRQSSGQVRHCKSRRHSRRSNRRMRHSTGTMAVRGQAHVVRINPLGSPYRRPIVCHECRRSRRVKDPHNWRYRPYMRLMGSISGNFRTTFSPRGPTLTRILRPLKLLTLLF